MGNINLILTEECLRKARITGGLCVNSILKYRDSIKKFFLVIQKDIGNLELKDFDDFILKMQDEGASNSRIANIISAVKWLIKKLQDNGKISNKLDLYEIIKPKIGTKEVLTLTEAEVNRFLDCILNDIAGGSAIRKIRMMALIMILARTGARIGEALSIKISDINWDEREIPIIGKGKKPRKLYIDDNVIHWINEYLSVGKRQGEMLFVTLNGKSKWSQTDVGRSFRKYRKMSGISKVFTLHTFRHTVATILALKGVPFNKIQRILGHTRLETTVKYYIGAVEDLEAKKVMQDNFFDFIPRAYLRTNEI